MKQQKRSVRGKKGGVHWNAMGVGLFTASLIYPEQQLLLLSMGCSSIIVGIVERLERRRQQVALQ
jgi:hypothetical protein